MYKLTQQTISVKKEDVQRKWYIVDAEGETVGRICTKIAAVLRGKNKPTYTPHVDTGDYVIVVNAEKVRFTGNKMHDKIYLDYSLHPGGQKQTPAYVMLQKKPIQIIERAVKGMLPKNKLGRAMYKKLFVYVGASHPHTAQQPEPLV